MTTSLYRGNGNGKIQATITVPEPMDCRYSIILADPFHNICSGSVPEITRIEPAQYIYRFTNRLTSVGEFDKGYIFSAPYSNSGWLTGTIPVNTDDFILGIHCRSSDASAQIIHAGLD